MDLEEWIEQAQEIIRPITEGSTITNRYFEVEKEAMSTILDQIEALTLHMNVMPVPCDCARDEECPGYRQGWNARARLTVESLNDGMIAEPGY